MKRKIKFKFISWFYTDTKNVIQSITTSKTLMNNLWLAAAFIYVKSNERRDKPCEFKYLCFKDIKKHANNIDDSILKDFIGRLKQEKIITVNQSYSADKHYSKQYAVNLAYKEQMLDIFHVEEIVELRISKISFAEWELLTKEDMFNILNEQIQVKEENVFDELNKENPYEEYEKNSIGYHQGETETEKILHQRMINNFNFDIQKVREHIINGGNYYEEVNKLIKFVKSTKHKTYSSIHGRVYLNGYSNGSKEFRDTFKYDDNALVQLMDVKSCFVLLTVILAKMSKEVDKEQINILYHLITQNDIYQIICDKIYGHKAYFEPEKYRNSAKLAVLRWFFMSNEGKKKCGWSSQLFNIRNYFKYSFPTYYKWLVTYNEIKVDGKKKSCLAIDCQWLENKLIINTLMKKFVNYKVVTLHDSLWISKDQYNAELKSEVEQYFYKYVQRLITDEEELRFDLEQINGWSEAVVFMSKWIMSKDFIREMQAKLSPYECLRIQQQIHIDTMAERKKTSQYFQNAITWIKNCKLYLFKELNNQLQFKKFNRRANECRQRFKISYVDRCGRVIVPNSV